MIGEGYVFEADSALLAEAALGAKPAAAQGMARPSAGDENAAESVEGVNAFEVAQVWLAAAHEDAGVDDGEMPQAVVAATDEAGEPEAPLVEAAGAFGG